MSAKIINAPDIYAECSKPWPDGDAANAAVQAFLSELRDLRIKHKIADVYAIIEVQVLDAAGVPHAACLTAFNGDSRNVIPMVARAYGEERERHEQVISTLIAQGRATAKERAK